MTRATVPCTDIADRAGEVRKRIAAAAARAGRDPSEVTLIAISKTRPVEDVVAAFAAGVCHFGENYVQEGAPKLAAARSLVGDTGRTLVRHFVGHLQSNKARAAADAFEVFHGIDSPNLLRVLGHHATRRLDVFIQVNLAGEASKGGVSPAGLPELVDLARAAENIELLGLMLIPPAGDMDESRRLFGQLRELAHRHGLRHLSMGMTDDFEAAVEEGATFVRVGRAVFGERDS
jgi:pyridoxal phosphate enzyme (YggS family)